MWYQYACMQITVLFLLNFKFELNEIWMTPAAVQRAHLSMYNSGEFQRELARCHREVGRMAMPEMGGKNLCCQWGSALSASLDYAQALCRGTRIPPVPLKCCKETVLFSFHPVQLWDVGHGVVHKMKCASFSLPPFCSNFRDSCSLCCPIGTTSCVHLCTQYTRQEPDLVTTSHIQHAYHLLSNLYQGSDICLF